MVRIIGFNRDGYNKDIQEEEYRRRQREDRKRQMMEEEERERDVATDVIDTRKMITTMMTMMTRNTNVVNGREEDANVKRKKRKWRGRGDASARE